VFSSPASGSSGSPQSFRERPLSPISPLFSNKFAPPFASTQQNGAEVGNFGGIAASQAHGTGLAKDGSDVFGMGYNSQFDLEGQIGMVSDLLERDVDFDGWLRDIPEVDAEG
jgi:neural Wiskott-Aldrich syndrome protein